MVEYANLVFKLSDFKATTDAAIIVKPAIYISQDPPLIFSKFAIPKMYTKILTILKTPALTTATACRSALTGVGATMAAGNHL